MNIKNAFLSAACLFGTLGLVSGCFGDISYDGRLVPCDEGRCPDAFRCGNDDLCYPDDEFPPCKEVGAKIPCDESGTGGTAGTAGSGGTGGTAGGGAGGGGTGGGGAGGGGTGGGGTGGAPCVPTEPPDEVCDGIDNDCNDETDEGLNQDEPCWDGDGVCRDEGVLECGGQLRMQCTAQRTEPPVADEDGDIDPALCDGFDNDCDGETDELNCPCTELGKREPCGTDEGICVSGERECVNDGGGLSWSPCGDREDGTTYVTKETDDETTCDGLDNDCDGQIDEELPSSCDGDQDVRFFCQKYPQAPENNALAETSCADDGQTCVEETPGGGICQGECYYGQEECDGNVRKECDDAGAWVNETCVAECDDTGGTATCVDCVTGDTKCEDAYFQRSCEDGKWSELVACVDTTCSVAFDDQCGGKCAPGQFICDAMNVKDRMKCNVGNWEKDQTCLNACYSPGLRNADCVECAPQVHMRCQSGDVWRCGADGTWGSGALWDTCDSVCEDDGDGTAECTGVCTPGKKKCDSSNTGYDECDGNGSYDTIHVNCPAGQECYAESAGQAKCVQCTPGETECAGNTLNTCGTDGFWSGPGSSAVACEDSNKTCLVESSKAGCNGECHPNQVSCSGNTWRSCDNGYWKNESLCSGTTPVCASGVCRECSGNDTKCVSGREYACSDNDWDGGTPCTEGNGFCHTNGKVCGTCSNHCNFVGETACEDGLIKECEADGDGCLDWGAAVGCSGGYSCKSSTECGDCNNSSADRCSNNDAQECSNGTWSTVDDCGGTTPVCVSGACYQCSGNDKKCESKTAYVCTNNNWSGTLCTAGNGFCNGDVCGTCPTTDACSNAGDITCSGGQYRTCTADATTGCLTWNTAQGCSGGYSCKSSTECGDCVDGGAPQCVTGENAYEICSSGTWSINIECDPGDGLNDWEVCRDGDCVDSPIKNYGSDIRANWLATEWGSLYANQWRLTTVVVPEDTRVSSIGAILSETGGGFARVAVWEDVDAGGPFDPRPGALVTWGYSYATSVSDGANELPLYHVKKPVLTAGTRYWVGIITSKTMKIRGRTGGADTTTLAGFSYGDVPVDPFPEVNPSRAAVEYGLYLHGRPLQ